jgi:hypothetical protein
MQSPTRTSTPDTSQSGRAGLAARSSDPREAGRQHLSRSRIDCDGGEPEIKARPEGVSSAAPMRRERRNFR